MKAVLISINPLWCELIGNGEKTVEVRKNRPKLKTPFKVFIYCTKAKTDGEYLWTTKSTTIGKMADVANGKVIGEFICDKITEELPSPRYKKLLNGSCLDNNTLLNYGKFGTLYGWHISNLRLYDTLKELKEFYKKCKGGCGNVCKHWRYVRVNADEYDMDCDCDGLIPITKPPQSWCYVEYYGAKMSNEGGIRQ